MENYNGNWIYKGLKVRVHGVQNSVFFLDKENPFFVVNCDSKTGSQFFVWFGDQDTEKNSWMNTAPSLLDKKSLEILTSQSKKVLTQNEPLEGTFSVVNIEWEYAHNLVDIYKKIFPKLVDLEKQIYHYGLREGSASYVRKIEQACDFLKDANSQSLMQSELQVKNKNLHKILEIGQNIGPNGPWGKPIEGNNISAAKKIMSDASRLAHEATKSSLIENDNSLIQEYIRNTANHLELAAITLKNIPDAIKKMRQVDNNPDYFKEIELKNLIKTKKPKTF